MDDEPAEDAFTFARVATSSPISNSIGSISCRNFTAEERKFLAKSRKSFPTKTISSATVRPRLLRADLRDTIPDLRYQQQKVPLPDLVDIPQRHGKLPERNAYRQLDNVAELASEFPRCSSSTSPIAVPICAS